MVTKIKTRIQISENELLDILMNVTKPTFTNILYRVKVRMNKTDNPYFEKVFKTTRGNFFIGGTYQDMVNTRMEKEGIEPNFESLECSVGKHYEGSKCVQFNEKLNRFYLQYFTFPQTSKLESVYEYEGNFIDRELFRSYEVKKSESSRQPQENKHIPQSLMLSSIMEISLNGNIYEVVR